MIKILLIFLICFPYVANSSLNGTYLICERTPEYFLKEQETHNENYLFVYFKKNQYLLKKIIKHDDNREINFSLDLYNSGIYSYHDDTIKLIDNLKFLEKKLKNHLDRATMILKSNYNKDIIFEHLCKKSDLKSFIKKSNEIIDDLKKFWKNKTKNNKI